MAHSNQAIWFSRYRPERIACSIQILEPSHDHRSPPPVSFLVSLFRSISSRLGSDRRGAVFVVVPARATLSSAPSASPTSLLPWLPSAFRAAPAPSTGASHEWILVAKGAFT